VKLGSKTGWIAFLTMLAAAVAMALKLLSVPIPPSSEQTLKPWSVVFDSLRKAQTSDSSCTPATLTDSTGWSGD
jgi:hypothetical protein